MTPEQILGIARSAIQQESEAVAGLVEQLGPEFVAAAELLMACEGHVLVAGSGTSHAVGARLAHLLTCCGTPALFIHPGDSQHGLSGAVTSRDILIALSKGGETQEVNVLVSIARQRGARVVAVTEQPDSTLGRLSNLVVPDRAPGRADLHGMIATGSSLVTCALGDALCAVLLTMRGYTREQFGQTHPGGAVGLRLAAGKDHGEA
jgi:D-arabinose 5-phosphate isomerase GutQ